MNILLVSSKYPPEYSGSGHRAHWLYRRLTAKHPEIQARVLCGSETENQNADYEREGFSVTRISCKPFPDTAKGDSLAARLTRGFQNSSNFSAEQAETLKFLESSGPFDLLHVFGQNYVTASVLAYARKHGIPTILELCNEMDTPIQYIPFPDRLWISKRLPEKLRIVCISERLKDVCARNGFTDGVWCRPNPVDEKRFHPIEPSDRNALRQRNCRFGDKGRLLVYVAKYIPRKNHIFLVDVLSKLPQDFNLLLAGPMAGSGPLADRDLSVFDAVRLRANELGLDGRVEVRNGFIEKIEEYYQMADVYLFPTKEEGLGTPMLESLACATPVVANIIPGITDTWIKDGRNGGLCELDPAAFAAKVLAAAAIRRDTMLAESRKIIDTAGTETIDRQYYEMMSSLVAPRDGGANA